jgi:hypothetical protein
MLRFGKTFFCRASLFFALLLHYHHYKTINCENSDEIIEGLEYVMIEPKFKPSTMTEKKMTILWLRFLNEVEENENTVPQDLLDNEYFRRAIEKSVKICKNPCYPGAKRRENAGKIL